VSAGYSDILRTYVCGRFLRFATERNPLHNHKFLTFLLSNRSDCSLRYLSNMHLYNRYAVYAVTDISFSDAL